MNSESFPDRIILNVGGIRYETLRSTLANYPETFLGAMFHSRNSAMLHPTNDNEFFIDRNGNIFTYILEFYRTGKMFIPKDDGTSKTEILKDMIEEEIKFFSLPLPTTTEDKIEERIDQYCQMNAKKIFPILKRLIKRALIQGKSNYSLTIHDYGIYSRTKGLIFDKDDPYFERDNMRLWYTIFCKNPHSIIKYLENDLSYLNFHANYVDKTNIHDPHIELNITHDPIDCDKIML